MPFPDTLRCPRCDHRQAVDTAIYEGCAACLEEGLRINLLADLPADRAAAREALRRPAHRSMWDFLPLLPVDAADRVDLGEGWTPLVPADRAGERLGLRALLLKNESTNVIIDFTKIDYIDSTGIGELVGYLGKFTNQNRKLILVNPSDRIQKLLKLAKLDAVFRIYSSEEEAVAAESAPVAR